MTQHDQTEFDRVSSIYETQSDEVNWHELLDQIERVVRKDYRTTQDDHQRAMELLWNHLENRKTAGGVGWLAAHYEELKHTRDDSQIGIFVMVYENVAGLAGGAGA
ncbi:hypothetical protein ACGFXC_24375 [Streptomyces sp. NPDC048507]|uniref:hypothetical protein n=1 Tax=Streptomyces sp. NPDC048507 TaxID=3365560 RepID=UPI00371AA209